MDMNKTFFLRKEDCTAKWHVIDATGRTLGRLATEIANLLRGKGKTEFTPHANCGDYVVVVNCEKIHLSGNKWKDKEYKRYSGYRSGLKVRTAEEMLAKHPTKIVQLAVKNMLPKNRLSSQIIKKLKVYVGNEHPHAAQVATSAKS